MPQSGKMNRINGLEPSFVMGLYRWRTKRCQNLKATLSPLSMRLSNMELMLQEWPVRKPETLLTMPTSPNKQLMQRFFNFLRSKCSWRKPYKNRKTIGSKTIKIRKFLNLTLFLKVKLKNKFRKSKQPMMPWFIEMSLSAVSTNSSLSKTHIYSTAENLSLGLTWSKGTSTCNCSSFTLSALISAKSATSTICSLSRQMRANILDCSATARSPSPSSKSTTLPSDPISTCRNSYPTPEMSRRKWARLRKEKFNLRRLSSFIERNSKTSNSKSWSYSEIASRMALSGPTGETR